MIIMLFYAAEVCFIDHVIVNIWNSIISVINSIYIQNLRLYTLLCQCHVLIKLLQHLLGIYMWITSWNTFQHDLGKDKLCDLFLISGIYWCLVHLSCGTMNDSLKKMLCYSVDFSKTGPILCLTLSLVLSNKLAKMSSRCLIGKKSFDFLSCSIWFTSFSNRSNYSVEDGAVVSPAERSELDKPIRGHFIPNTHRVFCGLFPFY